MMLPSWNQSSLQTVGARALCSLCGMKVDNEPRNERFVLVTSQLSLTVGICTVLTPSSSNCYGRVNIDSSSAAMTTLN